MTIKIRRISYALGAEIAGVDIGKPLDDETVKAINSAFLEHCVLVFREQHITPEQHLAFTRYFGEVEGTDLHANRHPDYPGITRIMSRPTPDGKAPTGRYNGQDWHTDESHTLVPSKATLLRAIELPEVGGNTMFSNCYLAYDMLSDGMKKLLEGLYGAHIQLGKQRRPGFVAAHPLVRVHPETGRKALYLGHRIRHIIDMTQAESAPLLRFLNEHATRPQLVYRHVWQKDDFVMWDDRCTLHIACGDFDRTTLRHLERTSLVGNQTGYSFEGPLE